MLHKIEDDEEFTARVTCDYPGCDNIVNGTYDNPLDLFFKAHELYMWQSLHIADRYFHVCARCYFKRVTKTMYRDYYLQTPHWKIKRRQAIERADGECEICGSTRELEVHHLNYENLGYEEPEDLMALCHNCHMEVHEEERKHEE